MAAAANQEFKTNVERAAERAISRPVVLQGGAPAKPVSSPARDLQNRLSAELEGHGKDAEAVRARIIQGVQITAYALSVWCVGVILYSLL